VKNRTGGSREREIFRVSLLLLSQVVIHRAAAFSKRKEMYFTFSLLNIIRKVIDEHLVV